MPTTNLLIKACADPLKESQVFKATEYNWALVGELQGLVHKDVKLHLYRDTKSTDNNVLATNLMIYLTNPFITYPTVNATGHVLIRVEYEKTVTLQDLVSWLNEVKEEKKSKVIPTTLNTYTNNLLSNLDKQITDARNTDKQVKIRVKDSILNYIKDYGESRDVFN